jgi:hypothetical protein
MKNNNEKPNCNYYEVESYASFHNVDNSILLANSFLNRFGYEFVKFNLEKVEEKLSELLSFPSDYKNNNSVNFNDSPLIISNEFFQALLNNQQFGINAILNKEIFFKSISNFKQKVISNLINMTAEI